MQNPRRTYEQPKKHYNNGSITISSIFFTISACASLSHDTLNETFSETESNHINEAYHRLATEHSEFNWKFVEGLSK